jgi:hypothetical protein
MPIAGQAPVAVRTSGGDDMAFGRGRAQEETPVPAVAWSDVRKFIFSTEERPATKRRSRPVRGPKAIRVPQGGGMSEVFAPCAYVGTAAPPAPADAVYPCLYEDADTRNLLCYLTAEGAPGDERRFRVHDGRGEEIGLIRRIPPAQRFLKHTWRIEQPGRPEIVGRNEWASGGAAGLAVRVTGKAFTSAVDSLFANDNVDAGESRDGRKLEWWAEGELIMTSRGGGRLTVEVDWLDRRLAFAFAVLGDS